MEENKETSDDTPNYYGSVICAFDEYRDMRILSVNELELQAEIDTFAEKVRETEVYRNYLLQAEKVKKEPELKQKIDEFRIRNFELQNTIDSEELFDKTDAFAAEYEVFRADPMVDAFLSAELEFCRMMQKVYQSISERVDFD